MDIVLVLNRAATDKTQEYYCHACGQLRLSVAMTPTECQNCGGKVLTVGDIGTLDKQTLGLSRRQT